MRLGVEEARTGSLHTAPRTRRRASSQGLLIEAVAAAATAGALTVTTTTSQQQSNISTNTLKARLARLVQQEYRPLALQPQVAHSERTRGRRCRTLAASHLFVLYLDSSSNSSSSKRRSEEHGRQQRQRAPSRLQILDVRVPARVGLRARVRVGGRDCRAHTRQRQDEAASLDHFGRRRRRHLVLLLGARRHAQERAAERFALRIDWPPHFVGLHVLVLKGCTSTSPHTLATTQRLLVHLISYCCSLNLLDPAPAAATTTSSSSNGNGMHTLALNMLAMLPTMLLNYERPSELCRQAAQAYCQVLNTLAASTAPRMARISQRNKALSLPD